MLKLSEPAYREIKEKLEKAGYQDQFHGTPETPIIDMHGIAVHLTVVGEDWLDKDDA